MDSAHRGGEAALSGVVRWNPSYMNFISRHRYNLVIPDPFVYSLEVSVGFSEEDAQHDVLMRFLRDLTDHPKYLDAFSKFVEIFQKHCDQLIERFRPIIEKEICQLAIYMNKCIMEDISEMLTACEQRHRKFNEGITESELIFLKSSFIIHCRYSKLCNDIINSNNDMIARRKRSFDPLNYNAKSESEEKPLEVDTGIAMLKRGSEFQTAFPLAHLVQDNLLDPAVLKIQNTMKADERFVFKRSNKVQKATLQALKLCHQGQMCLVDHSKPGGLVEYASMGFCDLIGRLPWEVYGNKLVYILGISNIDEQDERYRLLSARPHEGRLSSVAGRVTYPNHIKLMKDIEDFVVFLQRSVNIVNSDRRSLPLTAGIYRLHNVNRNSITEVVVLMLEVFMKEPDYDNYDPEEMAKYRRLLIIVADIGSVMNEIEDCGDSVIITNPFTFEHEGIASYLYDAVLKYTNEWRTYHQGLPTIWPMNIENLGWVETDVANELPKVIFNSLIKEEESKESQDNEYRRGLSVSTDSLNTIHMPVIRNRGDSHEEEQEFKCCGGKKGKKGEFRYNFRKWRRKVTNKEDKSIKN